MSEFAYDSDAAGDLQLRVTVSVGGVVTYTVNGAEVSREDFVAIEGFGGTGVASAVHRMTEDLERLADYVQNLDPDIADSLGERLLSKLQLIAECVESR